jgi:UDP-N-acetylglucosamine--N-acetylmuramyl-(pentapeptide) pyrophosphoryl-undecaprenol N-acetylglucosamine transferase
MSTVLIMAGGTGGHVFPALALARLLRASSHEVVWLGTQKGIEARVVPADNFPIEWLSMSGLRGKGALTVALAPFKLVQSVWQALGVMRRRRPALVVGFGGFVTGPGGVAAWLTRRPLIIHEQNAIAGYSNRVLSHLARRVLSAFP